MSKNLLTKEIFHTGGPLESIQAVPFDASVRAAIQKRHAAGKVDRIFSTARKLKVSSISYRSNGHLVNGFVVEPRVHGRTATEKLPCIIWNRGGSREFGRLEIPQVFAILGMFASWGYIVIASQYSGNAGSEGKDEFGGADLNDVLILPRILKQHPRADLKRIGMYGGSRGGMMTYMCLARVRWIRAAVTVAGASDLIRQVKLRQEMKSLYKEMFGGTKTELKKRSAVLWAGKFPKKVPLLMMHGTADWRVSVLDSLELSSALIKNGVHHKLVVFENDDHDLSNHRKQKWDMTREWFETYLKAK